jgi:hypothetical protein
LIIFVDLLKEDEETYAYALDIYCFVDGDSGGSHPEFSISTHIGAQF